MCAFKAKAIPKSILYTGGSRGLLDRVGLVTQRLRVRVSGPAGIVGGGVYVQRSLSTLNTEMRCLSKAPNPQLLPRRLSWLPSDYLCFFSSHCCVCAHLNGLNEEHKFRLWVTIIGHTSPPFLFYILFEPKSKVGLHVSFAATSESNMMNEKIVKFHSLLKIYISNLIKNGFLLTSTSTRINCWVGIRVELHTVPFKSVTYGVLIKLGCPFTM